MPQNNKPRQLWFDIETTGRGSPSRGFHFHESSIIEISFGGKTGVVQDLAASPNLGPGSQISHWSRQKAWEPLLKRGVPILTEREILTRFIKQLDMNTGAELIGWNIGYRAEAPKLQDALRGFDVPGLMARAAKYGLQDQMKTAIEGVKIRDIGQEFMARLTEKMFSREGMLRRMAQDPTSPFTPELYRSTRAYSRQMSIARNLYGAESIQDIARYMSSSSVRVVGWSQENTLKLFRKMVGQGDIAAGDKLLAAELQEQWNEGLKEDSRHYLGNEEALRVIKGEAAHQAQFDVAVARLLTGKVDNLQDYLTDDRLEEYARDWAALTERQKALNSITYSGFGGDEIRKVLDGEWYGNLPSRAEIEAARVTWQANPANRGKLYPPDIDPTIITKEDFIDDLGKAAEAKYGRTVLPKGYKSWADVITDLKKGETLGLKHGLKEASLFTDLFASQAGKAAQQAVATAATTAGKKTLGNVEKIFGSPAKEVVKEVGENIGKGVKKLKSKGGMLGIAAVTAGAFGPLGLPGTDIDQYKEQMAGHWKHVLLGELPGVNKIPGSDHLYNTVRGLPHSGTAHYNRSLITDFGSGWTPAHGNAQLLSDPEFTLEGNFEAMRRVQEAIADEKITNQEYQSFRRALTYQEDTRISSYYTEDFSYMERATNFLLRAPPPIEPNEILGVRIDPSVMDFRREVLQDREKFLDFKENLATKQRAKLEEMGRFERNELFEIDTHSYKEMALEASNMRAVNLKNFAIEVEDADTLLLRRKGLFSMFDDPISVRLSGIDAPETAGHKDDVLAQMGVRMNESQPYGEEATAELRRLLEESEDHQLLVSATPQTYGRYTGVVFGELGGADLNDINSWGDTGLGEQVNFNMELLRRGAVAALPFGSQSTDMISRAAASKAEEVAADTETGMWEYTRYKASRQMTELLKNSITFTTFTQRDRLAGNLDLAAYASYLHSMGGTKRNLTGADASLLRSMQTGLQRSGYGGGKRPSYMRGHNKSGRTYGTFTPPAAADYGEKQIFTRKIPYTRPWAKADDNFHNTIEGLSLIHI